MKKDISRELPPFFLPNTGNMGIPICLFAYGSLGMGVAAAISSLVVLLHFTVNIFLASKKFDIKIILKSPSTYAVIIAVAFLYFGSATAAGHLNDKDKKATLKCTGLYYANSMIPQGTLELDKIVYSIAAKKFLTSYLIKEGVKEDFNNKELF